MNTYIVEYEIFPMRAIYQLEGEADTEAEIRQQFLEQMPTEPKHTIRKVTLKIKAGYVCDEDGWCKKDGSKPNPLQ